MTFSGQLSAAGGYWRTRMPQFFEQEL